VSLSVIKKTEISTIHNGFCQIDFDVNKDWLLFSAPGTSLSAGGPLQSTGANNFNNTI
jgi:hypothetical protein